MRYEKEKLASWVGTPLESMIFNIMETLEELLEEVKKFNIKTEGEIETERNDATDIEIKPTSKKKR